MEEQKWEYCQLSLYGLKAEKDGTLYSLSVVYTYSEVKSITLATTEKGGRRFSYDPFRLAMGQLGSFGWEMVSVQHGHWGTEVGGNETLLWWNVIAYFKRPVKPGRNVDEPTIVLP